MSRTNVTAGEALAMLAVTAMRPFTKEDWYAFSGCESPTPMIGEHHNYTIVIDGHTLLILHGDDEYGGLNFTLTAIC